METDLREYLDGKIREMWGRRLDAYQREEPGTAAHWASFVTALQMIRKDLLGETLSARRTEWVACRYCDGDEGWAGEADEWETCPSCEGDGGFSVEAE